MMLDVRCQMWYVHIVHPTSDIVYNTKLCVFWEDGSRCAVKALRL
jgi:hypothetical protein